MESQLPGWLVNVNWLKSNLTRPNLKIIDCHYEIKFTPPDSVSFISGYDEWLKDHIPGSVFIDIIKDLSDRNSDLPATVPPADQFFQVLFEAGIGENDMVILYDRGESTWAARCWLLFQAFGYNNAALLDGGWTAWRDSGFSIGNVEKQPAASPIKSRSGYRLIRDKADVQKALNTSDKLICALGKERFDMEHIPGSLNIPAASLIDPEKKTLLPQEKLLEIFQKNGITTSDTIITYCGGGISASLCQFALMITGHHSVSMYDGSLEEWRQDKDCPIEATRPD